MHKSVLWLLEEKITPSSSDGVRQFKSGKRLRNVKKKKKNCIRKSRCLKSMAGKAICVAWVIAKISVQRGQNAWEWEWSTGSSKVFESNPTKGKMGSGSQQRRWTGTSRKRIWILENIMKCRAETGLLYKKRIGNRARRSGWNATIERLLSVHTACC